MMYYLATVDSIKDCLGCAEEFHNVYDPGVSFSSSSFLDYWTNLLSTNQGFMILAEHGDERIVGGAGGVVTNLQTSSDLVAVEMMWWVDPEFRGTVGKRLFVEFEKEAKGRNAKRILMACMENSNPEKVAKFYERSGYVPFERHFIKTIA
jgi:GNAT superfamily N-acetyltransferase